MASSAEEEIIKKYVNTNKDFAGIEQLSSFNGFKQNRYSDPALSGQYGFVFVTKPMLFLYPDKPIGSDSKQTLAYNNMTKDSFFSQFLLANNDNENDQYIIKSLSYEYFTDAPSLFLPLLTNNVKNMSLNDDNMDVSKSFQTKEGYGIPLPTNMTTSKASGSITMSFYETANLDIFKTIMLWLEYMDKISNGSFSANPDMIKANMLDFTCSIYYFLLGPDGRTIKYWTRYTSALPTNFPINVFSYNRGQSDQITEDISFAYTVKEDSDPQLLVDFDLVASGQASQMNPIYTTDADSSGNYDKNQSAYDTLISSSTNDFNSILSKDSTNAFSAVAGNPIVYYEKSTDSNVPGKFILQFSDDTLKDKQEKSILGSYYDDYLYDLLKKG